MNSTHYDAIVVGSGLGGLTAGALSAKDGGRVLVLERHDRLGGAATVFRRGDFLVEAGLHQLDGLDPQDPKREIFCHLGIDRKVTFLPIREFYTVRYPRGRDEFVLPVGITAGMCALIERFPRREAALRRYFATIGTITHDLRLLIHRFHDPWWRALALTTFPLRFPTLLRYARSDVGTCLDRLFGGDEEVKFALAANAGYYTDDLRKLSFLYYGIAQGSYHTGGGHYPQGGSQRLSDALAAVVRESGGETRTGRSVTRILVRDGRATGVAHAAAGSGRNGEEAFAPVIFGNAAPQVLATMLPEHLGARLLGSRGAREVSTSLWCVYLALNRSPAAFGVRAHSTWIVPPWMRSLTQLKDNAGILAAFPGERTPFFVLVNYHAVDCGLTRFGTYSLQLCGLDRLSNWEGCDERTYRARKAAWLDHLLATLEQEFAGIAGAVVYREMATARTMRRYLNTPGGAVYGYAPIPRSTGFMMPRSRTPVPGLYLASTFAPPGGGFSGAIFAGRNAYFAARRG